MGRLLQGGDVGGCGCSLVSSVVSEASGSLSLLERLRQVIAAQKLRPSRLSVVVVSLAKFHMPQSQVKNRR